jgi:hypothetical protein
MFFKQNPPAAPVPVPPTTPSPTPVASNAVMAQLLAIQRQLEQGFAKVERRIGRMERDLIDLKTHAGIQRRPPLGGRHNENDEPMAVVNADI